MTIPGLSPVSSRRKLLSQNNRTTVYLQADPEGPTVLKVLNADSPTPLELARFLNELEVSRDLDVPGVRKAIRRDRVDGRHALVLEYARGEPLHARPPQSPRDLEELLRLAIRAARALGGLHRRRIVHKDINLRNLIFDPAEQALTIIDLGLASRVDLRTANLGNPRHIEGTLAYMSPEQTGRMSRVVDHRSDLYSLGATFYELATGSVPFETSDPLELVHQHLALAPAPPHRLNDRLPEQLSAIVLKLLHKNADERYQSAFGLAHDLERCLSGLVESREIRSFPLAERDASGRLRISDELYGREADVARLLSAFESAGSGVPGLVLVSGRSGVGKSALANELHRALGEKRGYFIQGKFDLLQRNIPYHAPVQAFRAFVDLALAEDEGTLAELRDRILSAVGELGKVLTTLVPNIELILGTQPDVPQLAGTEALNRFEYVLGGFLRAISPKEHPLVLFLDDLQWADAASRQLINAILTERGSGHFLLVGAYRDDEVDAERLLPSTPDELRARGVRVDSIRLEGLSLADVEALTADALSAGDEATAELASLVYEKTRGNAFFVRQLFSSLEEQKLISFDFAAFRWRWDPAEIQRLGTPDNAVDLVTQRMNRLPPSTARVLRLAACIGTRFDLETLALVDGRSVQETGADLLLAAEEALIVPRDGTYKLVGAAAGVAGLESAELTFAHDRIQQAAYAFNTEEERRSIHARVGRLMLERTPAAERSSRIFDIVNQLNFTIELLSSPAERRELAALNLEAGRRAALAIAFRLALDYLDTGSRLLGEEGWRTDYPMMLALRSEAAEAAYLCSDDAAVQTAAREVLSHGRDILDKEKAYFSLLMSAVIGNRLAEALRVGTEVLDQLGVSFPREPGMHHVAAALVHTKILLARKPIESLYDRPEMTDRKMLAAMYIIEPMCPAAFRSGSKLFPLLLLRMVTLSVRHGNMPVTPFAYASYGLMLAGILGDLEGGYRFGELSRRLNKHFDAVAFHAKVEFVINSFVAHWKRPLAEVLPVMRAASQFAVEVGGVYDSAALAGYGGAWAFLAGEPLAQVERHLTTYRDRCDRVEIVKRMTAMLRQVIENLVGEVEPARPPSRLVGAHFSEVNNPALDEATGDKTEICYLHLNKLFLHYMFGEHDAAIAEVAACERFIEGSMGFPLIPFIRFYTGLARLSVPTRRDHRAGVKKSISLFRKWVQHEPVHQLHRLRLLEAEEARVAGKTARARELYDQAIEAARRSNCLHEEALAFELASRFQASLGSQAVAGTLMERAISTYRQWGAGAKVSQLGGRQQQPLASRVVTTMNVTRTTTDDGIALDLGSLMKASAAISGEIVMERLLDRLIRIVLENAGAEDGAVLLHRGGELAVAAQSLRGADPAQGAAAGPWIPLGEATRVCEAVVRYVVRRQEPLVLRDALTEGNFQQNPYVRERRVRSVLCMPIKHHGRLAGVLYLENNLVAGAFTDDRCRVLDLLSSQAAIALENARLYATLDERVKERTAELQRTNDDLSRAIERLKDTQNQLVVQEKLASLGALTAGIAHEIKNPLNFINNFSELSVELVRDLRGAFDEHRDDLGDDAGFMGEILADLEHNAAKIKEHGKRTDGIVNSMLDHVRVDTGEKRETDLSSILDEYANLAYHGLKSRYPSIDIEIERGFDPALPPILIATRDIGRVFLNLVNNACYAVRARAAREGSAFSPRISLSTRGLGDHVEIRVGDNGDGIPEAIRGKVFNPFFTTKPSGEGTGLGLSISYDIVVNGNGGALRFESVEGRGTEFIVTLPA